MEACVSEAGVTLSWQVLTALTAPIVTLFWLLIKAKDLQIAKAEAREAEWRRVAVRGSDEIIPSLALEVRESAREQLRELRGQ